MPWIDAPGADIAAYLRRARLGQDETLRGHLEHWSSKGFTVFRDAVDPRIIETALKDLDWLINSGNRLRVPLNVAGSYVESDALAEVPFESPGLKLYQLHCLSRAIALACLAPPVMAFLRHILGGSPAVLQTQTMIRSSQQPIHVDWPLVSVQTSLGFLVGVYVCLEDMSLASGPIELYPGAHTFDVTGTFDWGGGAVTPQGASASRSGEEFSSYVQQKVVSAGIDPAPQILRAGDVVAWHANMPNAEIVASSPSETRTGVMAHFTSIRFLPQDFRAPFAEVRGLGVFENGGHAHCFPWMLDRPKLPSWS